MASRRGATAASIRSPQRRAPLSMLCPTATATSAYSSPRLTDRTAVDYDAPGRLSGHVLEELGVPREADFYLCGPPAFMSDFTGDLAAWGVTAVRLHTEIFGSGPSKTPGVVAAGSGRRAGDAA